MLLNIITNFYFLALHVTKQGSFPAPLSAKKENELIEKNLNGDKEARDKLIEHNLRLVAHIVKKYDTKLDLTRPRLIITKFSKLTKDINYDNKKLKAYPGMNVSAEIKTRKKKIIDFFLEPFQTYKSEALRER